MKPEQSLTKFNFTEPHQQAMTDRNSNFSKEYLYHNLSIDGVTKQLDFDELVDYLHHLEGKVVDLQRRLDRIEQGLEARGET